MNDVSWGTREVPKSQADLAAEAENQVRQVFLLYYTFLFKAKEASKAASTKKDGGLLGYFQVSFLWNPTIPFKIKFSLVQSMAESKKKGNLEFSLGNLFSCLCFTTEDQVRDNFKLVTISGCLSGRCQEGSDDDG